MAVGLEARLPRLPPGFGRLQFYLLERDLGGPAAAPTPIAIVQTTVGSLELDRIAWGYTSPDPTLGRDPDGFVIWWINGSSTNPTDGGVRVSGNSRAFSMLWPSGEARSYAVAAFRNTHQGEALGAKQQHATWVGAT